MAYDLYPAVDETYNFAVEVRVALAKSYELRNTVVPMTTAVRNNLTTPELWDGRVIVNTTTDHIERYDLQLLQWFPISDATDVNGKVSKIGDTMSGDLVLKDGSPAASKAYVDSSTPDIYQGVGPPPTGGSYKTGDIYCQYT